MFLDQPPQYNPLNQIALESGSDSSEQSASHESYENLNGSPTTLFTAQDADYDVITDAVEAIAGAVAGGSYSGSLVEVTTSLRLVTLALLQPKQVLDMMLALGAQALYFTSAVQPSLNAWTAFEWLFAGNQCSVRDPACYIQWHGPISLLVYFFVFCTFYANYRISLEFMPSTIKALLNMANSAWNLVKQFFQWCGFSIEAQQESLNVVSGIMLFSAFLLAGGGATVTFELGTESLVLFKGAWAWLNTVLLVTAVGSTLSTRFISCRAMLHIFYQRLLAYLYVDVPLRFLGYENAANFYEHRRLLLTGMFDMYSNEYLLPDAIWSSASEQIKAGNYLNAFQLIYNVSEGDRWPGLLAHTKSNVLKRFAYNAVLFICYFFAIASYPIIYNITRKAFAGWEPWATLSYGIVLASTLFYVYAIGRLPDQVKREVTMSLSFSREHAYTRGLMCTWSFFMSIASCGNFLYSALDQANQGMLDHLGLTHEQTMFFFPGVGGVISGGCNLYAVLSIDERYAVSQQRYRESSQRFSELTKFIESASSDVTDVQADAAAVVKNAYRRHVLSGRAVLAPALLVSAEQYSPLLGNANASSQV